MDYDTDEKPTLKALLEQFKDEFQLDVAYTGSHLETYGSRSTRGSYTQNDYEVTVTFQGRTMTTAYHSGRSAGDPNLYDVLYSWLSDSEVLNYNGKAIDWAMDLGFEGEAMFNAQKMWDACCEEAAQLQHLLGEHFDLFFPVNEG